MQNLFSFINLPGDMLGYNFLFRPNTEMKCRVWTPSWRHFANLGGLRPTALVDMTGKDSDNKA